MDSKEKKNTTATKVLLLMSIGFVIDVGQALIVFNTGKRAEVKARGGTYKWKLPAGKELLQTAGIVIITSLVTGLLVSAAESALIKDDKTSATKPEPVSTT